MADVIAVVEQAASPSPDAANEMVFFEAALMEIADRADLAEEQLQPIVLAAAALHRTLAGHLAERLVEEAEQHFDQVIDKVTQMHEEERRRITRELHDRAGSWLTVAHHHLEQDIREQRRGDDRARAGRLEQASNAIVEAMQGLRTATSALRQRAEVPSLVTALRTALDPLAGPGLEVKLRVYGDEAWASDTVKDEVFLILREAAHNAVRHGRPTRVEVVVAITPDELRASVTDDGAGFSQPDAARSPGIGLSSMRERAGQLHGALRVSTAPGRGTKVSLRFPLSPAADRAA